MNRMHYVDELRYITKVVEALNALGQAEGDADVRLSVRLIECDTDRVVGRFLDEHDGSAWLYVDGES